MVTCCASAYESTILLNDYGVLSIEVDVITHAVTVIYEPDAPFEIDEVIAYVTDMSEGRSDTILIYEGPVLVHFLRRSGGCWNGVATRTWNGIG